MDDVRVDTNDRALNIDIDDILDADKVDGINVSFIVWGGS